jgi:hypothetical protein
MMKTGKSKSPRTKLTLYLLFICLVLSGPSVWAEEIIIGNGTSIWTLPLVTDFVDARTQIIYLSSEINGSYNITALALCVPEIIFPGQTINNFTIRMKHTDISVYDSSPNWESSGWTTVYQANPTVTDIGWVQFDFAVPFEYNGTQNLMIDISSSNTPPIAPSICLCSTPGGNRTIYCEAYGEYGDPLTWSGNTPPPYTDTTVPDVKLIAESATQVLRPVFTPDGGIYNSEQTVVITCATDGATIHYTTNGNDPTESDPTIASGGTVLVSVDPPTTLKARAWKTDFEPSNIKEATYLYGLINNPSMEDDFIYQDPLGNVAKYWTGWGGSNYYSFSGNNNNTHQGAKSQQVNWNGQGFGYFGPSGIYQQITGLTSRQGYKVSAWCKTYLNAYQYGYCNITWSIGIDPTGGTNPDDVAYWESVSDWISWEDSPWCNVTALFEADGETATIFIKAQGEAYAEIWGEYGPEPSDWHVEGYIDDTAIDITEIGQNYQANSRIEATSPIPANGASCSDVTITVLDSNSNPVMGISPLGINLDCTGNGNITFAPDSPTDVNGQTIAKIASSVPEIKTVSATVLGTALADTATARFCKSVTSKLRASDGAAMDLFGCSVAVDGDTALVGAYGDDDKGSASGSAYIFHFDGLVWEQETKLLASDGEAYGDFGRSVAIDGNTALIGAGYDYSDKGSAYVFRFNGSDWVQEAKLLASDGAIQDCFGYSVDVEGNTAVIGAYGDDDKGSWSGSAYIFRFNGSTWIQEAKLLASDGAADDRFGFSVAIDDNIALIGAYRDDDKGSSSGSAYVFYFNGSTWTQQAKLLASDGAYEDYFGICVAVDSNTAIIGADGDDNGSASGSAYIFRFNGSTWTQEAKVLASDGAASDYFGLSVAIDGNTAIVGACGDDDNGSTSGSAYVFLFDGSNWVQQAKLLAPDGAAYDNFGYVAVDGDIALVGVSQDDDYGDSSGSAYVFPTTIPGDIDGDGVVDFFDYCILADQWLDLPNGDIPADIAPCGGDCLIDFEDLKTLAEYWLE